MICTGYVTKACDGFQGIAANGSASLRFAKLLLRRIAVAVAIVMLSVTATAQVASANPLAGIGNAISSFFGMGDAASVAALNEQAVADPSTLASWENLVKDDTNSIGCIWTDKTVSTSDVSLPASPDGVAPSVSIDDSDFLVLLSALSSTSNITVTSEKPLDIALVLDTSGSMGEEMPGSYDATYEVREDGSEAYYALVDGSYERIVRKANWPFGWFQGWELNGEAVKPMRNAGGLRRGTHTVLYHEEPDAPRGAEVCCQFVYRRRRRYEYRHRRFDAAASAVHRVVLYQGIDSTVACHVHVR